MKKITMAVSIILLSLCFTGTVLAACEYYDSYGDHSWVQTGYTEPSCEDEGGYTNVCEYCGTSYFVDMPATHHDWHWLVVEDASCTEEGLGAAECWNCGMRNYEPIQPYGHTWESVGTVQQATCVQTGIVRERCANCGAAREQNTGTGSHTYGEWKVSRAATDHSKGTRARSCTQCGNVDSQSFYPEGTVLRGGSNDTALVKELQQMLVDQKYLQDVVDGIFGKNTEAAVKAFQAEHHLTEDGIGWPQTIQAIRRAADGEMISQTSLQSERFDFYRDEAVYTLSQFRDIIEQQNELCAIAYLGAYEAEQPDLPVYLEVAGVSQEFPFLLEIPEEHFLTYEGDQLYCIVPADEDASVTVNTWLLTEENDYLGEAGETIYESDSGDPFFVRGNISDIMPNLQILIVDSEGKSVEYYPFMSLEDNTLELPNGGGVLDFTPYGSKLLSEYQGYDGETEGMEPEAPDTVIKGESPDTLIGDWTADSVYTQNGEEYNGTLTFYENGTLEFGSGKISEPYENYYTGRWTYREQAEEGSEYSGTVEMELTRTEESAAETKEKIAGIYIILRYGEELISITRLEGEDLFPDQYWNDIRFTYAVG